MAIETTNKVFNTDDTEPSPYEIAENITVEIAENVTLEITIGEAATSDEEIRIMI
jgi:hypothetical protein